MTSVVALRCRGGVVIGADSAVTFGTGSGNVSTIERHTSQKLRIIGDRLVLAGTGQLGLMQRFHSAVENALAAGVFEGVASGIEFAKRLSAVGIRDFKETHVADCDFTACVGFSLNGDAHLCELDGSSGFQPEMKELDDLWYVSSGYGQTITDPFLALLHEAFWADGPPNLRGGIFSAVWTLKHVCKLNVGGVGDPINIAVLDQSSGFARLLGAEELAEHENVVDAAMRHLGSFRDILEGKSDAEAVPTPKSVPAGSR